MKKRTANSIKGLILILIVLGAISYYFYHKASQDNLIVTVKVYYEKQLLPNTTITINDKKINTNEKGEAKFKLKVSKYDKLIIKSKNIENNLEKNDTLFINNERYLAGYAVIDVVI